jgi:hypothetical protein
MPQNIPSLLFPRAKWNTAQVKLFLLSTSQVIKLTKANKLGKRVENDFKTPCRQKKRTW